MRKFLRKTASIVFKNLQNTTLIQAIEEQFEIFAFSGVTSRHFEYPFAISQLVKLTKKGKKNLLDAGPTGSLFPLIAASLGIKVTGIDILPWDIQFKNYTHLLADLKKIPIESNYFDLVSSISTMEHLGLPRFGETPDKDADIKGMKELIRVLKPKGHIILTVPFGKPIIFQNKHRVYDKKALKKLIGNLKIVKQEFFAPVDNILTFRPCTQEEVFLVDTKTGTYGVNCIVAQKI